ncbi:MAG: hypothetical protein KJI71_00175 [Patescibacteria group bacterium]|nr:hypothetical protein [Patescibacteria group bacterium]
MNNENGSKKEEFEGFRYNTSISLDFHEYDKLQELSEELISTGKAIKIVFDLGTGFDFDVNNIHFLTDDIKIVEETNFLWFDYKLEKFVGED